MVKLYEHHETIKSVANLLSQKMIIPIFGSGFTKNESSHGATVPDGEECKKLFMGLINKYGGKELEEDDLTKVSDKLYRDLSHKRVPETEFLSLLKIYFTGVHLSELKKNFLRLSWPLGFTLNIDDGIEKNSDFKQILPYQDARKDLEGKVLYKLHGDANHEITYRTDGNLVFNFKQYIRSLQAESNQTLREALTNAYKDFNMIFIGCSLYNEPDLNYIYASINVDEIANKENYFLCTELPFEGEIERLEDDYGITAILHVDDYNKFYEDLVDEMDNRRVQEDATSYQFMSPRVEIESGEKYFTGYNIFNRVENTFHKSDKYITRDLVERIEKRLKSDPIVCVFGQHLSGKTALLCELAHREKQRTVSYFPSDMEIDEDVVRQLVMENNNILFLFDSNSVGGKCYNLLFDLRDHVLSNRHAVVLAVERDDFLLTMQSTDNFYQLHSRFSKEEYEKLKLLTDKMGWHARKRKDSNLDYLYRLKNEQHVDIYMGIEKNQKFTRKEQMLLLILATKSKVYSKDYSTVLGISSKEMDKFLLKTKWAVEKVNCIRDEARHISSFKLVHNSKLILLDFIGKFEREDILYDVYEIVKRFKGGDYSQRSIYKDIMKFDTLNSLFSHSKNAGSLIFAVYENLMELLSHDNHYWLQRSKSIYRLKPGDKVQLLIAYKYAKKAYTDSQDIAEKDRLTKQSALSISLICCLLTEQECIQEEKEKWEDEAIIKGYEAIFSVYFNQEMYMKKILTDNRKNYVSNIVNVCMGILNRSEEKLDPSLSIKAQKIKDIMEHGLQNSIL